MRIAAIDMGTNSFLCLIGAVESADGLKTLKVLEDHSRVVRLGEKVSQNKFFLPEALSRAKACLEEFSAIIKKAKPDKVIAIATSAARDAKNGSELFEICRTLEIPLHIIEGSREAELSFAGAISTLRNPEKKKILVVDVGGGSTELIHSRFGGKPRAQSFDVGCVRLTEMFLSKNSQGIVEAKDLLALEQYADGIMSGYGSVDADLILAVAGTPTTLACVDQEINFDESKVEGFRLTKEIILKLKNRLIPMTNGERKKIVGLEPLRADVIVAGCVLLEISLKLAHATEMIVSTRGLRFGVAIHHEEFT